MKGGKKMRYKILVLDDKQENLDAAVEALKQYGEVKTATNYDEGIKVVDEFAPDIAFIDLNFPKEANGLEEKLGFQFRDKVLDPNYIPHVIVTAGVFTHAEDTYHNTEMFKDGHIFVPEGHSWHLYNGPTMPHHGGYKETNKGSTKDTHQAWQEAYSFLVSKGMECYLEVRSMLKEQGFVDC